MLVLIVVFMFINPETRISVAVGAVVLIVAALAYVIKYGKKIKIEAVKHIVSLLFLYFKIHKDT